MKRMTYALLCAALNMIIFGGISFFMGNLSGFGGMGLPYTIFGALLVFLGIITLIHQLRFGMRWNRVVRFMISQEQISFDDVCRRVRLPEIAVSDIIFDAIYGGTLSGIVRDDVFISRYKLAQEGIDITE